MDTLFPDHDRLAALPPEQIPSLLARLAAIQSVLTARLLATPTVPPAGDSEPKSATTDQFLTAEDAAQILRVSPRWLYRHANRLPFARRLSRKCLRFSEAGLRRWQASKKT
jgi:predicted DNA-binding transcriptional regulator AlpA